MFDSKTLFYDCVYLRDGNAVVLQGPPFLNLKPQLRNLRLCAPSNYELQHSICEGDRHVRIWASAGEPVEALRFLSDLAETELQLNADCNEFFQGMRVLLTVNKDNNLDWILDWIRFHRDVHGANGVLLYDNSSTVYGVNELMAHLQTMSGIDRVCVVAWRFKFGPNGRKGFWDSDFCHYGVLENARWRFLQKAKSVLSCDIDELVVTGGNSVFELAEASKPGYVRFHGRWIVGIDEETNGGREGGGSDSPALRHADFQYALRFQSELRRDQAPDDRCPPKWAAVPARCLKSAQWMIHQINGMTPDQAPLSKACYRHFRQINTSWKYDRSQRDKFNPALHYLDEELVEAFKRVRWND